MFFGFQSQGVDTRFPQVQTFILRRGLHTRVIKRRRWRHATRKKHPWLDGESPAGNHVVGEKTSEGDLVLEVRGRHVADARVIEGHHGTHSRQVGEAGGPKRVHHRLKADLTAKAQIVESRVRYSVGYKTRALPSHRFFSLPPLSSTVLKPNLKDKYNSITKL